ncbi:alpha/beta fold hydrolase [Hydrogenophaga sp. PAMC20947]|uniref:alpha/beta fold hydrolase n=1 Tax=Hydrogenophaga sp. PAMC20947 TaxID=2565558 RepID=UPI001447159E|nr:alpha/beta fold hydrolase [Hydrogenophaga sp. PAMC20947]
MAYRVVGNRAGEPWLLLHGGPGASAQPGMLRPLDLTRHWAIAPDQRGAGASKPKGRTVRNTTAALVSDLETLRQNLGVERWNVIAGSWGTVVALAYLLRHPQRVERMVLRGAFAVSRRELAGLLQPRQRVAQVAGPDAGWPRAPGYGVPGVLAVLRRLVQSGTLGVASLRAVRRWNILEMACAVLGLRRSLRHAAAQGDARLGVRIRRDAAALSRGLRRAKAQRASPRSSPMDRRLRAKYRVQGHYLSKRGFVRPGELDRAVRTAVEAGVAIDWVHGRFDAVCPSANSQAWAAMGSRIAEIQRLHLTRSGHLGTEPDTLEVLRRVVRRAGTGLP